MGSVRRSNLSVAQAIKLSLTYASFSDVEVLSDLNALLNELEIVHSNIDLEENETDLVDYKDQLVASCKEAMYEPKDDEDIVEPERDRADAIPEKDDDDDDERVRFADKDED